jgi:hypothetical protein
MVLQINEKYRSSNGGLQGTYVFHLVSKYFQFRWFTDCGEWFIYIHIGKKWCRFSGAGFMKSSGVERG